MIGKWNHSSAPNFQLFLFPLNQTFSCLNNPRHCWFFFDQGFQYNAEKPSISNYDINGQFQQLTRIPESSDCLLSNFSEKGNNELALTTLYSLEDTINQRKDELGTNLEGKPSWTKKLLLNDELLCSKIRYAYHP